MLFYSLIIEALFRIAWVLSPVLGVFFPKFLSFISERKKTPLNKIKKSDYVFFCSSAGEYDQIIPILQKLKELNSSTFIIFFSISGIRYLQKTNPDQPCILMPYDSTFFWAKLFKSLQPKKIMVVRYEFWPAFLKFASKKTLYLLFWNKQRLQNKPLKKRYYRWCLSHFEKVFCIDNESKNSLIENMGVGESRALISGDSKYERSLSRKLDNNLSLSLDNHYIVIGGSVWPKDLEILLPAFKDFASNVKAKLILVPHDISESMIQKTENLCSEYQLTSKTHSTLPSELSDDVVIIDSMGQLASIYPVANFAFIGGAMHHRVHNILEAASANLDISFGPHYETSHEAKLMVKENLVNVSGSKDQLHQTLTKAHQNHANGIPTGTLDFIQKRLGASKFITDQITNHKNQQ